MPIVITPTGQFIDSVTGNPVDLPPQRPDLPMQKMAGAMSDKEREMIGQMAMPDMSSGAMSDRDMRAIYGARSRENIPANMDMGMNSEMPVPMTVVDQVNALMAMGLTEDQALEAIAIEQSAGRVNAENFSGSKSDNEMGALSGIPAGNQTPMAMPTPRPEDLMMRQMEDGRDKTFNPNDPINSYNAPNT
jgi:hypothetical protein